MRALVFNLSNGIAPYKSMKIGEKNKLQIKKFMVHFFVEVNINPLMTFD